MKERRMAYRPKILFSLLVLICSIVMLGETDSRGQKIDKNRPQSVTLYCRTKHQVYEQSVFNFQFGVNGDAGRKITHNRWNIHYGDVTINHDSDFFKVPSGQIDCSRIIDLGEKSWSEIDEKVILDENQFSEKLIPCSSLTQFPPPSSGKTVTDVNINIAKAHQGHMYLVHNLGREINIYTLFRVDELVPSDTCTISWKVIKRGKNPS
jgi:hypothetical protein